MDTTKTTFFLFSPPWKRVKIYFSANEILKEKLFKSLAQKTAPNFYTRIRTSRIFCILFNWFFKREKEIPNTKVFLIYEGYDSTVFFYIKEHEIGVIRKKDGKHTEEEFLGYPIHFDFSLDYIPNKKLLQEVLRKHWIDLKSGKTKIHGDFTHNNILVDENEKISFIDKKKVQEDTSVITDLFYFYAYFLIRASLYRPRDKRRLTSLENDLNSIYSSVFEDEDKTALEMINKLSLKNFNVCDSEYIFNYWKKEFYNLVEKVIDSK